MPIKITINKDTLLAALDTRAAQLERAANKQHNTAIRELIEKDIKHIIDAQRTIEEVK